MRALAWDSILTKCQFRILRIVSKQTYFILKELVCKQRLFKTEQCLSVSGTTIHNSLDGVFVGRGFEMNFRP